MRNWQGKNVIVVGAARQGLAATRFLAGHGANVTLTDNRPKEIFPKELTSFLDKSVECRFGSHPLSMLDGADLVCVSGGVPLEIPLISQAEDRGIPLSNDAQIFLESISAKVIGITGSAGKTTTTTLIGEIAKHATQPPHKVWVGGNIGNPLIEFIEEIESEDWVIMELSSFQLELMHTSPGIALVLNITPNHLDRHKTMKAYTRAKINILNFQGPESIAILNRDDSGSIGQKSLVRGKLLTFGLEKPENGEAGTFIEDDRIKFVDGNVSKTIMPLAMFKLAGLHNQMNALAASAAGIAAQFSTEAIRQGIEKVTGIPHRLELIREHRGIRWYNDSIATAPERVIAAIDAIPGALVILLGGRDKSLPWGSLIELLKQRKAKVVIFGEAGAMIENLLREANYPGEIHPIFRYAKMDDAVQKASEIAKQGEAVLLSPGCTSYDAFQDFEERGNSFKDLVEALA